MRRPDPEFLCMMAAVIASGTNITPMEAVLKAKAIAEEVRRVTQEEPEDKDHD